MLHKPQTFSGTICLKQYMLFCCNSSINPVKLINIFPHIANEWPRLVKSPADTFFIQGQVPEKIRMIMVSDKDISGFLVVAVIWH